VDNKKVRANAPILTRTRAEQIVSQAVRHAFIHYDGSQDDMGQEIGCDGSTIGKAINGQHLPRIDTLFNLLRIDPFAVDGLLQHYGRRSVPIEAKCNTDALLATSAVVHDLAQAKGRNLTDYECLECEASIDAALDVLSALKNRCLTIRKDRAA